MLLTIEKKTTETIDIGNEVYVKYGRAFFRIINGTDIMQVDTYDFSRMVSTGTYKKNGVPFSLEGYEFCTKEEFDDAFWETMKFMLDEKKKVSVETETDRNNQIKIATN